jgi:hypothetical protein
VCFMFIPQLQSDLGRFYQTLPEDASHQDAEWMNSWRAVQECWPDAMIWITITKAL